MKYGLSQEEFLILEKLLIKPLRKYTAHIWIFGSRARGDHKPFSDIDILFQLKDGGNLPDGYLFQIKDDLENSNLPYKVDVVNESELAASYRENVLKDRVEI